MQYFNQKKSVQHSHKLPAMADTTSENRGPNDNVRTSFATYVFCLIYAIMTDGQLMLEIRK